MYNFGILHNIILNTRLLKLLYKMCKYKIDQAIIVEVTERTSFCPQTGGRTDRRTDDVNPVYPFQIPWSQGYIYKTWQLQGFQNEIIITYKFNSMSRVLICNGLRRHEFHVGGQNVYSGMLLDANIVSRNQYHMHSMDF